MVEPVAYMCLRFMLVREGRLFVHSRHGTAHARPGMLVIVCAGTLCGAIPEPSATVTTAFVNLDYLLDQLTWRLNGLLRDRHEAELIAAKAFRHNMWATTPPAQHHMSEPVFLAMANTMAAATTAGAPARKTAASNSR